MNLSKPMGRPRKPTESQKKNYSIALGNDDVVFLDSISTSNRSAAVRKVILFYKQNVCARTFTTPTGE